MIYDYSALSMKALYELPGYTTLMSGACKCGRQFTAVSWSQQTATIIIRTKFRNHIAYNTDQLCIHGQKG